jgi:hypothetical protein
MTSKQLDDLIDFLFTNGFGEKATRLILVRETRSERAKISGAKDLGGLGRAAVRLRIVTVLGEAEGEVDHE